MGWLSLSTSRSWSPAPGSSGEIICKQKNSVDFLAVNGVEKMVGSQPPPACCHASHMISTVIGFAPGELWENNQSILNIPSSYSNKRQRS